MSVGSSKNSVFDYLRLIKDKAKGDLEIEKWCDEAAELIDDYMVDGKACRRERINPLE